MATTIGDTTKSRAPRHVNTSNQRRSRCVLGALMPTVYFAKKALCAPQAGGRVICAKWSEMQPMRRQSTRAGIVPPSSRVGSW